jgi:preprotein translocase subunit SecF
MLAIIVFVAWAFRSLEDDEEESANTKEIKNKEKGPSSWSYGFIAVIALFHDIIIPTGIFIWLGLEVNSLFIVGLLSILGLSVNDTIVVFDRIREKVRIAEANPRTAVAFDQMVGESITQTMTRSINTSLTLFVALIALYFVGPAATQDLALVMILGMIVGTYSSIFLASPLLVLWQKLKGKK